MNSQQVIKLMEQQNGKITSKIIKDLISEHTNLKLKTIRLFNEYAGDTKIKGRQFTDPTKINNKLPNDFRGALVDQIVGYMFGEPIKYLIAERGFSEVKIKNLQDVLEKFLTQNNIDDLDNTTGTYASVCSYGARLCYIDKEGQERVMNIKPWEVIFVTDSTLDEVQYAMIYYDVNLIDYKGDSVKRTKVEWYDNKYVTYFLSDGSGNFNLDDTSGKTQQSHMFDYIPVIRYMNNELLTGDFEKIGELIDAYDRDLSDIQNEIEEFRLAYFAFYGCDIDESTISKARNTGAFVFPEKDSRGEFIVKNLDSAVNFIENHKKTLSYNIYKFSKSIDMTDETFSGSAMSGESRKWKLVDLEYKAIIKERKFTRASREMFRVICSAWKRKNIDLNYEDIKLHFTRSLPVDLLYTAQVTQALKGSVSEETRLQLMPFVKDVKAEIEKINAENENSKINLI